MTLVMIVKAFHTQQEGLGGVTGNVPSMVILLPRQTSCAMTLSRFRSRQ